jgi:hypothetical protein
MWAADAGIVSPPLRGLPVPHRDPDGPASGRGGGAHSVRHGDLTGAVPARGGDFLTAVPAGGDLYLLKRILVDRMDDEARTLLRNIRRAMAPQGRVLVADPESRSPYGQLYDMLMLMVFGSRLRTEAEVQALFAQSGFTLRRAIETRAVTTLRLLEGVPA